MIKHPHEHQCSSCCIMWPCYPGPEGCRIHHRDLCPRCAREAHEKLRSEVERLKRGLFEIESTELSSDPSDYQALPDKARALLAGEESSNAERLIQDHVVAHKKTAKKLKVAEQQIGELKKVLEQRIWVWDAPGLMAHHRVCDLCGAPQGDGHGSRCPLRNTSKFTLVCDKCGYSGPISHPHPRHLGEGMCTYAAGPVPEVKCNCDEEDRKVSICAMHPFTIHLNGTENSVGLRLSYEDAVEMSGLRGVSLYTVAYAIIGQNRGGSLTPGQSVKVEAGMSVDVSDTSNA